LTLSGSSALVSKNAGTEALTSLGSLTLNDGTGGGLARNYQLTGGSDVVAVTPLAITVAGSANNKTYDGTTAATLGALGSNGVIAGDVVSFTNTAATFNTKDVTTASTVTIAGITESGADAGNYTLNSTIATASAIITPAIVNLAGSRVYDALLDANANIFGAAGTVATGIGTETLTLSGSSALVSKNAGTVALTSLGSLALNDGTGAGAGLASNYQLTGGSDVVSVTRLAITASATGANKVYDGTAGEVVALQTSGVLANDLVAVSDTAAIFNDKNVGNAKPVSITGISLAGADAGNYLVNASTLTSANITPATLTETAQPVIVAAGQAAILSGGVSGFVPGDTRANATAGSLVWVSNGTAATTPGSYAIDGSGLTAENYVLIQSPINATALTLTAASAAAPVTQGVTGLFGISLGAEDIATPYGVGSSDYGNNTGNARRDKNPATSNQHLQDFTGRLALTVVGAGVKMPAEAAR
jgi:hypothetical protein